MVSTHQSAATRRSTPSPEAARILRVTPATIYRAIREDAFPAVRIRTRYVIPATAVDWLAASHRVRRVHGRRGGGRAAAHRSGGAGRSVVRRGERGRSAGERVAACLDPSRVVRTDVLAEVVAGQGCASGRSPR